MKALVTTVVCVGLLAASAVQAQDFHLFRAGLTYQFSELTAPGDTMRVLRLAAGTRVGADSVFAFAARTSRSRPRPTNLCGEFVRRPDHLFGATLTVRPGAEYVLTAASGTTLTLRPRAMVGQVWAATASGLTARVTSRNAGLVLSRPDTLAAILFSDGATLVVSKTYGLVSGPTLATYLNPRLPRRAVFLSALPEAGLGVALTGTAAAYDFQPGDVFLRRTRVYGAVAPCGYTQWERDSISSRTTTAGGDSVRYLVRRQQLRLSNCGAPLLLPVQLLTLTYGTRPDASSLTSYLEATSDPTGTIRGGLLHHPAWRTAAFNGRPIQLHQGLLACPPPAPPADTLNLFDATSLDQSNNRWTAPGLGVTHTYFPNFVTEETWLEGYRKGTESWGMMPTFAQLLPARSARPATTTAAFPNPFADELTVRFELAKAQPVALELRDALGRAVLTKAAAPLSAGSAALTVTTGALPAGLYTLHLRFVGDGHQEVLKVVKK